MSYSSEIVDLNPYFYFPMDIKDGILPLDLQEEVSPSIIGDYGYELSTKYFSGPLDLLSGSLFILESSEDFSSSEATYSFWVSSDLVEQTIDIFSIHSGNEGVGVSYFKDESEITLHFYSQGTESFAVDFDEPLLITLTVSSGVISFYINKELVFNTSSFTIPAAPEIFLAGLSDAIGAGSIRVSDFFYLQSALILSEIANLYSLGYEGFVLLSLDSVSSLTINDSDNTFLQTAWQAYGEVTTKK